MKKFSKVVVIAFVCICILAAFITFPRFAATVYDKSEAYARRPVECDSSKFIPYLEKTFDINFPDGARDIKTAKTPSYDETTAQYLIKFSAGPADVNNFFESLSTNALPGERLGFKREYKRNLDRRELRDMYAPKWFRQPIKKGFRINTRSKGPNGKKIFNAEITAETTDEDNLIVYILGVYNPDWYYYIY